MPKGTETFIKRRHGGAVAAGPCAAAGRQMSAERVKGTRSVPPVP